MVSTKRVIRMTETIDDFQMIERTAAEDAIIALLMFPYPISGEQFDKAKEMFKKRIEIQNKVVWKTLFGEDECSQTATGNT